jgi:PAS domain S-box-containing protein
VDGGATVLIKKAESSAELGNEFRLLRSLTLPGVVKALELLDEHTQPTLVLEDFAGESLETALARHPRIDWPTGLAIARNVARVLAGLHSKHLIHLDVRPANLLLEQRTAQVCFIDCSAACSTHLKVPASEIPQGVVDWAYISPEQTGRTGHPVDHRSDLYSLGVMLYRMLTGRLPFQANDPVEWVHYHLARTPPLAHSIAADIPEVVSEILMRLLAKTPQDRYQSGRGLVADIDHCLAQWHSRGHLEPFRLGERDFSDELQIPHRLYGRAAETELLLETFERMAASSRPELICASGYSGIGKSSLVQGLRDPILRHHGYFIAGKFDQYQGDIPFATLTQAFQDLTQQILGESASSIEQWRQDIQAAVGMNGQIILEVLPQIELILGTQPAVPTLPPTEQQTRFREVFRQFTAVFCRKGHPLVLFLDDVQWIDSASLKLIEYLITHEDTRYLLLIVAYRDNEVGPNHPLRTTLAALRTSGVSVVDLEIRPLSATEMNRLVSDTLHLEASTCEPLTRLIFQRAGGNPFFFIQFFDSLHREGLLECTANAPAWTWDLHQIEARDFADNVVDLMVRKLRRLAPDTQAVLQVAAYLGNKFDLTSLAQACGKSEADVEAHLAAAVREDLITYTEGAGKFLHDRIQQAAYALIKETQRASMHLQIGRALSTQRQPEWVDTHLFEIVNQLNRGAALITSPAERERVAMLNLRAGQRAKQSTAYTAALNYAAAGEALLTDTRWTDQYRLAFELSLLRAECEYLTGALEQADVRLSEPWRHATSSIDRAAVTCLRIDVYTGLDRSERAVEATLDYLRSIGLHWTPHPNDVEVQREYDQLTQSLGSRSVESLIELPPISDPEWEATIGVLARANPPVLFTDPNLYCLMGCRFVRLSLEHGNSDPSCFAYLWLGTILGPRFGDYGTAYRFGKLGYDLAENQGRGRFQARAYMVFAAGIMPWTKHLPTSRPLIRRAFELANKMGDLMFAAYCCPNLVTNLFASGDPLEEVQMEAERGLEFARRARFGIVIDHLTAQHQLIRQLRGQTPVFSSLNDAGFDEARFEQHLEESPSLALTECWYWIRKLQSRLFAGDYSAAVEAAAKAERLMWTSRLFIETADYEFFAALAHAQAADSALAKERDEHLRALIGHHRQLAVWAKHCPANFEDRAALVAAELARLEGGDLDAIMGYYEQANATARQRGFVQNEALTNELAARCLLARGFPSAAKGPLEAAHAAYARWGAEGKVRQLEQLYPQLRAHAPQSAQRQGITQLDFLSVAKASQAISGEIVFSELIHTLMRIMIESAGAQSGYLLLVHGDTLALAAEARASAEGLDVQLHDEAPRPSELTIPCSVINYVHRSRALVLLGDAAEPNPFSADPYFASRHPKSVLCLPIVKQNALNGVLYLENDLFPYAFTPGLVTVLELLTSQIAISIGSARLYADLQHENQVRRRAEEALQHREARIRRLVDSNIIGILFYNFDGRITAANDALLQMSGYSRDESLSGKLNWIDLTPEEYRDRDAQTIERLRLFGVCAPYEKEYIHKDGHRVPVLIGAAAFQDSTDEGVAFVLDLRERKQAEADRRAREVAEAANRAKSEFLTGVSHDLRTPLNAILGYAQILRQDPTLGARQRERVSVIHHSGEHLLQLIEDLLDLAKIEAGRLELSPIAIALPLFLQRIAAIIAIKADEKGITFVCDAAPDLPAQVFADQKRLRQILLNLLGNAVKFTEAGQIRLAVHTPAAGRLHFAVHDTGIGIPADQLDRIFEPYEQLGEEHRRARGTGLGLAISRQFVRLMGGELLVRSDLGIGSTFWFELEVPVVDAETGIHEPLSENEPATVMPAPPSSVLAHLHRLALQGNMGDIANEARRIASLDPHYLPFTNKVQALARACHSQAIVRLIESSQ